MSKDQKESHTLIKIGAKWINSLKAAYTKIIGLYGLLARGYVWIFIFLKDQ